MMIMYLFISILLSEIISAVFTDPTVKMMPYDIVILDVNGDISEHHHVTVAII